MFGGVPANRSSRRAARASRLSALKILHENSGQATVEYILLLAFVVSIAGLISRTILKAVNEGILLFGAQLERNIQSGKLDVGNWNK